MLSSLRISPVKIKLWQGIGPMLMFFFRGGGGYQYGDSKFTIHLYTLTFNKACLFCLVNHIYNHNIMKYINYFVILYSPEQDCNMLQLLMLFYTWNIIAAGLYCKKILHHYVCYVVYLTK